MNSEESLVKHVQNTTAVRPQETVKKEGANLFVMVHGFQGSSNDLKSLKNEIALLHPNSLFLLSKCNENRTEDDIRVMGERLAKEVE